MKKNALKEIEKLTFLIWIRAENINRNKLKSSNVKRKKWIKEIWSAYEELKDYEGLEL